MRSYTARCRSPRRPSLPDLSLASDSLLALHRHLPAHLPSTPYCTTPSISLRQPDSATPHLSFVPLSSPRIIQNPTHESSAPRRGLAGRTIEQLAGRAGGSLALAGGPPPSRHGCQAPQALSTGTRWGGPARARRAWWPQEVGCRPCLRQRVGVLGQRPESSVWCGCPAARVPVHAAAVRCPVRASERPGVRCPAWRLARARPRHGRKGQEQGYHFHS
jgi:hypothetical protein